MSYLIDTNVISELRKGERADAHVVSWFESVDDESLFLSVLVVGEIRRGIANVGRRDEQAAAHLERWLKRVLRSYGDRVLDITTEIAESWGSLQVPDPLPVVDSLLAATALVHDMTLVTRNVTDVRRTGVSLLNPFHPV